MFVQLFLIAMNVSWAIPLTQEEPKKARSDDVQSPADSRPPPEERAARRTRRRERWRKYREATPEERQKMRNDRLVDMATRTYDLDDMQQEMVRAEIQTIRQERRLAMGDQALEYDKLREEMSQFWQRRREQGENTADGRQSWRRLRDDPKFKKLREKMRSISSQYPFDWRKSIERIEAMLPEEQAQKGHAKLEGWRNRRRSRRGDRSWRSSRDSSNRDQSASRTGSGSSDPRGPEAGEKGPAGASRVSPGAAKDKPSEQKPTPRPLHPWEKYVQDFSHRYALSPAQQAAALSILKDELRRAEQIERINAPRIARAEQLKDKATRDKQLKALNKPIDQLFTELKTRLDRLLTAAQRHQVNPQPVSNPKTS